VINRNCFGGELACLFLSFVIYLATLSLNSDYIASNNRTILNNKLERTWKEAVVEHF
jgi:hypothetical protein